MKTNEIMKMLFDVQHPALSPDTVTLSRNTSSAAQRPHWSAISPEWKPKSGP